VIGCNRLRIGHTYLTHSYILKDEDLAICIPCNSLLTVEHILISCIDFDIICNNFYTASNLKDLFHGIHPKCIISFLHAIGLTNKRNCSLLNVLSACTDYVDIARRSSARGRQTRGVEKTAIFELNASISEKQIRS